MTVRQLVRLVGAFGIRDGCRAYARTYLYPRSTGSIFSISINGREIWLRKTVSDITTFMQIFVAREYDTRRWRQNAWVDAAYRSMLEAGDTPVIIDAGANIGLASVWYAAQYPKARIYAVEPDAANMAMLTRNTKDLAAVVRLQGAVWDQPCRLGIANPTAQAWGFRMSEGEGDVASYTVPDIVAMAERGRVLIAKIDIEGGENALFRSNLDWVSQARLIVMELHDWRYPGDGTSANFLRCIAAQPIDFLSQGENIFAFRAVAAGRSEPSNAA
jgi:FkbM family methyltransferase